MNIEQFQGKLSRLRVYWQQHSIFSSLSGETVGSGAGRMMPSGRADASRVISRSSRRWDMNKESKSLASSMMGSG